MELMQSGSQSHSLQKIQKLYVLGIDVSLID